MKITYLGHAGFFVETEETILIMDAWVSNHGAFDGGWFQFPCNHQMGDFVVNKLTLNSDRKNVYVYVSHEHKDHFDKQFLKRIDGFNFKYIIPRFRRTLLFDEIRSFTKNEIVLCEDEQILTIGSDEKLIIFSDDSELNRDSAIFFESGGRNFLNLNDCKIQDRLGLIHKNFGDIDVLAAQYSGATWHPTCYEYPEEEYLRISRRKVRTKFENTARAIELCKAKCYIPSAGPPCFLDPDTIYINFEKENIFPRESKLISYLERRLRNSTTSVQWMTPEDALVVSDEINFEKGPNPIILDSDFHDYIIDYSKKYDDFFKRLKKPLDGDKFDDLLKFLMLEFKLKLDNFKFRKRIERPLYISFFDSTDIIKVDFYDGTVFLTDSIVDLNHYSMRVNASDIQRIMDGFLTWEDYALSFRMKLNREPDVFQTLIQGFLILEKDDLNFFCDSVLKLENTNEKITVEVGGCKYRINRFCPHQGADMRYSWEEDNKYIVCPRHGWKFDISNDGECLENDCSIESYPLEDV
jgi:UDP-MurNAc hydroxylase